MRSTQFTTKTNTVVIVPPVGFDDKQSSTRTSSMFGTYVEWNTIPTQVVGGVSAKIRSSTCSQNKHGGDAWRETWRRAKTKLLKNRVGFVSGHWALGFAHQLGAFVSPEQSLRWIQRTDVLARISSQHSVDFPGGCVMVGRIMVHGDGCWRENRRPQNNQL